MLPSLARLSFNLPPPTGVSGRDHVLFLIARGKLRLQFAEEFQNDREVVLAAVKKEGDALEWASETLQADRDVVMAAVKQNGMALRDVSYKLRANRDVVLAAVKKNDVAMTYADVRLRSDRDFMLAAVTQHGIALYWASPTIQADREVVMIAVKQNGWALGSASDKLKGDRDVVLAAVKQDGRALLSSTYRLKGDREVVLAAVAQNGDALEWAASEVFTNDLDVELAAAAAVVSPKFDFIPKFHEPLSNHIVEVLELAWNALLAFEGGTGPEDAIVVQCNRLHAIENAIGKVAERLVKDEPDNLEEYLKLLNDMNNLLGNVGHNACLVLYFKNNPPPPDDPSDDDGPPDNDPPSKRRRIETALASIRARVRM